MKDSYTKKVSVSNSFPDCLPIRHQHKFYQYSTTLDSICSSNTSNWRECKV